jgi:hypothetical protein
MQQEDGKRGKRRFLFKFFMSSRLPVKVPETLTGRRLLPIGTRLIELSQ